MFNKSYFLLMSAFSEGAMMGEYLGEHKVCPHCTKFLFPGDEKENKEGKKICKYCKKELEPEE